MTDELDLVPVDGGTRFRVRVSPKAKRATVLGVHDGALKISVQAPPERGKANEAVAILLSAFFGRPVTITAGAGSPNKTVVVALDAESIRRRLSERAIRV